MRRAVPALVLAFAACAPRSAPVTVASTYAEDSTVLVTPTGRIEGTLAMPVLTAHPVPVVLIIAGSGPTDRNGNTPVIPGANNSLRMLAEGLAVRGIASVRYDKRGIAASRSAMTKEADIRFDHFVSDAEGWISQLRADPRFSTVTVAGHSEGSLIGMIAAKRANADAFVSLEGGGRNAKDIIAAQLFAQLPPAVVDQVKEMMTRIEKGEPVDSVPPFLMGLFRPSVRPYLASWFRYTPSSEIAKLSIPVLVIQGTTDLQTTEEDARLLSSALPSARLVMIEGMNHVLKNAPPGRGEQMPVYSDPSIPVVPRVIDEIARLVAGIRKPARGTSDSIIGIDKVKHFFIAGFIETMVFGGAQAAGSSRSTARSVAMGTTAAASIGREIYDRRTKGLFSIRDLAWDALGAGAALLVLNKTQR